MKLGFLANTRRSFQENYFYQVDNIKNNVIYFNSFSLSVIYIGILNYWQENNNLL